MENFNAKNYRDNLAKDLKDIRKDNPEKAQEFLREVQETEEYQEAKLIHQENKGQKESKEKLTIPVLNVLQEMGRPSLQSVENNEITLENVIDIDARALQNPDCPYVIFGRPHAGEYVPKEVWDKTTQEGKEIFTIVDRGTHDIFKSEKIPSVGTKINRYLVDLNRSPYTQSDVPGNVTWFKGVYNESVFKENEEPSTEELSEFVKDYYLPYQKKMNGLIGAVADRRENKQQRILIIDGHSFSTTGDMMATYFKMYGIENPKDLPMFIIGDGEGYSCDLDILEAFTEAIKKNFEELTEEEKNLLRENVKGDIVGLNHPFKGVHNVKYYGERNQSVNGFQIECNESLYIDESEDKYSTGKYNLQKLHLIKRVVEKSCTDVDYLLKTYK